MKYAYCALLYGNSEYFLGAMLLGFSLQKVNTKADVVIMVTNDVPEKQRKLLKKYFKVVPVDFIKMDVSNLADKDNRFEHVFTKLRALEFVQYSKVMLIDIDMFVLKNMDHLFELNAPAASSRSIELEHGAKIDPKSIYIDNTKRVVGSINAGLMLLEPNKKELDRIIKQINSKMTYVLKNPEQDYLSYEYRDRWTNLSFSYNCQFSMRGMEEHMLAIQDIHNLHYSWILNPWELVLDNKEKVWFILKKQGRDITYYSLWATHYRMLRKMIKESDGVDIKDMFDRGKKITERINELYVKMKKK